MADLQQDTGLVNSIEEQAAKSKEPLDPAESLHRAYIQSLEVDPDHAAKVIDYSKRLDLDPAFVDKHAGEIDLTVKAPTAEDWKAYAKSNPTVAGYFNDNQEAVSAAKDDFDRLGLAERYIKEAIVGWTKGNAQARLGELRAKQLQEALASGSFSSNDQAEIDRLKAELKPYNELDARVGQSFHPLYQLSSQLPNMTRAFVKGGAGGDLEVGPAGVTGGLSAAAGAAIGGAAGALAGGVGAVPGVLAGARFGAGVGSVPGLAKYAYDVEAGSAFDEYLDINGVDPAVAAKAANKVGLINAALETAGEVVLAKIASPFAKAVGSTVSEKALGALAKVKVPGADAVLKTITANPKVFEGMTLGSAIRQAGKMMLLGQASEISTEFTQEMVTGAGAFEAQGKSIAQLERGDYAKIASDATGVIYPTFQSTLLFGVMGGAGELHQSIRGMKQASDHKDLYMALGENAKESKFRQRLPEKHQELVAKLTKDGPVEHVFIPADAAETYFQANGINVDQAVSELGISKQEFQDAKDRGSDLKIPLSTWVTKVVDTVHYQGLADDVKFSEGALTNRQAQEVGADIERKIIDQLKAITDEQEKKAPMSSDDVAALREIKDVITAGQKEARPEGAKASEFSGVERGNAELWQRVVRFRALGTGQTIRQTFEEMRPLIQRGDEARALEMAASQSYQDTINNLNQIVPTEAKPQFSIKDEIVKKGKQGSAVFVSDQIQSSGQFDPLTGHMTLGSTVSSEAQFNDVMRQAAEMKRADLSGKTVSVDVDGERVSVPADKAVAEVGRNIAYLKKLLECVTS